MASQGHKSIDDIHGVEIKYSTTWSLFVCKISLQWMIASAKGKVAFCKHIKIKFAFWRSSEVWKSDTSVWFSLHGVLHSLCYRHVSIRLTIVAILEVPSLFFIVNYNFNMSLHFQICVKGSDYSSEDNFVKADGFVAKYTIISQESFWLWAQPMRDDDTL